MKHVARLSVFFLLFQILFVRCSDSKETDEPLPPAETYLTVLSDPPQFTANGGEGTLLFSTDEAWQISFDIEEGVAGDWYAAEPLSGDAGEKIAVTVILSANEEYDPRSVTLVLSTATHEKRIPVSQNEKHAILLDDQTRYELTEQEQTLTVRVRANVEYRVKVAEGAEWIAEAPQSRGLEQHEHAFRIAQNTVSQERTGRIVFEDAASDLRDELTVVQAAWKDLNPDRTTLQAIYDATGGAGWTRSDDWGSDKPLGEWYGVETDDEGHVVALRLPRNNLSGTIPAAIAELKYLRDLDLSWNALEGALTQIEGREVRSVLDDLTTLETVNLSHNRITGQQMPAKWGAMKHLRVVDLSSNLLQGDAFPAAWNVFFENGRTVDLILNDNELAGRVPTAILQHRDWDRLAMQFIRQRGSERMTEITYGKAVYLPDFLYTDLKSGSQQEIRSVIWANKLTMLLNWDPTEAESLQFVEQAVRHFRTLYGPQGFEVVALVREGDRYREAAERYVLEHDAPWIVATGCTDAQGRRVVLPDYPYPSYLLFDQYGKLVYDIYYGKYFREAAPGETHNSIELNSLKNTKLLNKACDEIFGLNNCTYQSTDFSKDKQYVTLHHATQGRGIDLILLGDGFTDVDIETGFYREVMDFAMESFFALEPVKSFRQYFNVYMIYAVSKERTVGEYGKNKDTALCVRVRNDGYWFDVDYAHSIRIPAYIAACPLVSHKDYTTAVIVHGGEGGLTKIDMWASEPNYAFTGFDNTVGLQSVQRTFLHETVGHAFGLLDDEYVTESGTIMQSDINFLKFMQSNGNYLNVSVTSDPASVPWSHLIGHPNYPEVGIFEGGHHYAKGVWRSEEESIMRTSRLSSYFNAISRELIYKRIMTLAGEEYTFEKFLAFDSDKKVSNNDL